MSKNRQDSNICLVTGALVNDRKELKSSSKSMWRKNLNCMALWCSLSCLILICLSPLLAFQVYIALNLSPRARTGWQDFYFFLFPMVPSIPLYPRKTPDAYTHIHTGTHIQTYIYILFTYADGLKILYLKNIWPKEPFFCNVIVAVHNNNREIKHLELKAGLIEAHVYQ